MTTPMLDNLPPDPKVDALLDEALAPPPPPADLATRIVARTAPLLAKHREHHPGRVVLARIGFRRVAVALAAAAAIALAFVSLVDFRPGAEPANPTPAVALLDLDRSLDRVLGDALASSSLEAEVDELTMALDAWPRTDLWTGVAASLDSQITDLETRWDDWDSAAWDEPASF